MTNAALPWPADDDTGVHSAVRPECGDDAAMMTLQKRTGILEFHDFPPMRIQRCADKGLGPERRHGVQGMLTIALSVPENHVTGRLFLHLPHRCQYGSRRFDLNRYFDDEEAGTMGRDYKVIDADGHILEPVDLWTITWTLSIARGRRACLRIPTAKIA